MSEIKFEQLEPELISIYKRHKLPNRAHDCPISVIPRNDQISR